jgi:hypothetical protein
MLAPAIRSKLQAAASATRFADNDWDWQWDLRFERLRASKRQQDPLLKWWVDNVHEQPAKHTRTARPGVEPRIRRHDASKMQTQ